MPHPLTDKKAFKKFYDHTVDVEMECLYTPDGIRAAADWQLKQVMKWLYDNLDEYSTDADPGFFLPMWRLISDLELAMRPTQEDNK